MKIIRWIAATLFTLVSVSPLIAANLGSVNVSSSSTTTVTVTLPSGGTVGSISVVTQGVPNADFTDAGGGSCTVGSSYSANATCTVNVKFAPQASGARYGAVVLSSSSSPIGTAYIQGTGVAPILGFSTMQGTNNVAYDYGNYVDGIAVDPAANVYFTETEYLNNSSSGTVWKSSPASNYQTKTKIGSGFLQPACIAIDGAGNLFILDSYDAPPLVPTIYKETLLPGGGYSQSIVAAGFMGITAIVADGSGNLYIADAGMPQTPGGIYKETLTNGVYLQTQIGTGVEHPSGVAVDGDGNVYVSNDANEIISIDGSGVVLKETPSGNGYVQSTISAGWSGISEIAVDGNGILYVEKRSPTGKPTLTYRETPVNGGYVESQVVFTEMFSPPGTTCPPFVMAFDGKGNIYSVGDCAILITTASISVPLKFDETAEGQTSPDSPQVINVANLGNAPLEISQLSFPEDFPEDRRATADCISGNSVQALGTCNLSIDFSPITPASASTTILSESLSITTNSLNVSGSEPISLTGTETNPLVTMAVSASPDPAIVGNKVTITATLTGTLTVPTGTVTFYSGATVLSAVNLANGVGSYTSSSFTVGAYSITAAYSGDATYTAQSKTFTLNILAPPPLAPIAGTDLGLISIGSTSSVSTVSITFNTAETLGSVAVLTQGVAGLDFQKATGGTCTTGKTYNAADTCTVNVDFKPRNSGPRYGAVVLHDNSGNTIGTGYLQGKGLGAQITFSPAGHSILDQNYIYPAGVALDGSGNLYVADAGDLEFMGSTPGLLYKETPIGGKYSRKEIGSGLLVPWGVAVDGGGNVYIADLFANSVYKETLQADGNYIQSTIGYGFTSTRGVAVDGNGNVFVADAGNQYPVGGVYKETPSGGGYVQTAIGSGWGEPAGLSVDGSGNIYVADLGLHSIGTMLVSPGVIKETPSGNGYVQSPVSGSWPIDWPNSVTTDGNENVYVTVELTGTIFEEMPQPDGTFVETTPDVQYNTNVAWPHGSAFNARGDLFIGDSAFGALYEDSFSTLLPMNFPSTAEGLSSSPQTVTVTNSGNASMVIDSITTTGDFSETNTCGTSLASGASCTISVIFNPTDLGTRTGTLTITDNVAGSSQTANLKGTGTNPAPQVTISPVSLNFAPQPVGSTSAPQTLTLTNTGTAVLSSISMSINDGFAETNTCGTSLAIGASCAISVTFTGTAPEPAPGTLTITDNASTSPQTVALFGNGSTISFLTSPNALTVSSPGGSATDTIQVNAVDLFSGTVDLTCKITYQGSGTSTDLPTCSLSPTQVQISSGSPMSSTLKVSTTAASARARPNDSWRAGTLALGAVLFIGILPRRRKSVRTLVTKSILLIVFGFIGCGGGSGGSSDPPPPPPNPGTTAGVYQAVVTGTSGTLIVSTTITTTVQ